MSWKTLEQYKQGDAEIEQVGTVRISAITDVHVMLGMEGLGRFARHGQDSTIDVNEQLGIFRLTLGTRTPTITLPITLRKLFCDTSHGKVTEPDRITRDVLHYNGSLYGSLYADTTIRMLDLTVQLLCK